MIVAAMKVGCLSIRLDGDIEKKSSENFAKGLQILYMVAFTWVITLHCFADFTACDLLLIQKNIWSLF